jgi:hypothetical protein
MQVLDIGTLIENVFDHLVDIAFAYEFGEHHSLVDAVSDQGQRKVRLVRFDLGRESMELAVFIDVVGFVEEYRTGLVESVRDIERRMTDENPAVDAGSERLERNSARSVTGGDLN